MKKIIIANFKMHTVPSEFKAYAMSLATKAKSSKNDIIVCPPFTHLAVAKEFLGSSKIELGAQNIYEEECGQFTGEVSGKMVKDAGASYVIVGHSDRRARFKENDKLINKKIKTALASGLKVILCVGESLAQKQNKESCAVVRKQIDDCLKGIYENELESVIVAYEPVWAVGTGKVATKADITKMVDCIRKEIESQYSAKAAKNIAIVYGGSVTASNHTKILENPALNGVMIGTACLDADTFSMIARESY